MAQELMLGLLLDNAAPLQFPTGATAALVWRSISRLS